MATAKRTYSFGGGRSEGSRDMKELLGGKGADLAEMWNIGIPVPPGFTITTVGLHRLLRLRQEAAPRPRRGGSAMRKVEALTAKGFG